MENIKFCNRYGSLELKPVTDYMPVDQIKHTIAPIGSAFNLETAEKIALITENRRIQLCIIPDNYRVMYVVHHSSTSIAAICEINSLAYNERINPQQELERLAKNYLI